MKAMFDDKIVEAQKSIQEKGSDYDNSFVIYIPDIDISGVGAAPKGLQDNLSI